MGEHLGSAVQLRCLDKRIKDHGTTMTERGVLRVIHDLIKDFERAFGVVNSISTIFGVEF